MGGNPLPRSIQTPDIPKFGMGDDPTLVIKKVGIIRIPVPGKNGGVLLHGLDMLSKLHQVQMVQGQSHHPGGAPLLIQNLGGKSNNTIIAPPFDYVLRRDAVDDLSKLQFAGLKLLRTDFLRGLYKDVPRLVWPTVDEHGPVFSPEAIDKLHITGCPEHLIEQVSI